jgi:hypothetical protein
MRLSTTFAIPDDEPPNPCRNTARKAEEMTAQRRFLRLGSTVKVIDL